MKIYSINNLYKNVSFKGARDENQSLTKDLHEMFADPTISPKDKAVLWHLSETPGFCEASKYTPKEDILKLLDLLAKQKTNVLQMALDGDVKVISQQGASIGIQDLLSFTKIAKHNKKATPNNRKNLYEYVTSHQVMQIEKDVRDTFQELNFFPHKLPYIDDVDKNGNTIIRQIPPELSDFNMFINMLKTGSPFAKGEKTIIFSEKIKGKMQNLDIYRHISPKSIEEPYPIIPTNLKMIYSNAYIPRELRKAVYEMGENPYFANLIKNTPPEEILIFAKMDIENDNIFNKIINGKVKIGFYNADANDIVEKPLLDTGRILKDRKDGKIKSGNFFSILSEETIIYDLYKFIKTFKNDFPDKNIKSILFGKEDDFLHCIVITKENDKISLSLPKNLYIAKKIYEEIDKYPYRVAFINFDDNSGIPKGLV